jgi:ferredoxin
MKCVPTFIHHVLFFLLFCVFVTIIRLGFVSSFESGLPGRLFRSKQFSIGGWRSGLYSSSSAQQNDSFETPLVEHALGTTITVSYAGKSCNITVGNSESILSALERQSTFVKSQLTDLPDLPSDCRRGNCLTCAASLVWKSVEDDAPLVDAEFISTQDDGLSPTMSEMIAKKGYILTCSSFITPQRSAPAIRLELGVQQDVWKEVYRDRFATAESQLTARAAMARVLRQSAERNLPDWMRATERVLRQTEIE